MTVRLSQLEEELGKNQTNLSILRRIKRLDRNIDKVIARMTNVERYINGSSTTEKVIRSLHEGLSSLELSLGLEPGNKSIESRITNLENYFSQRVTDLEREVYRESNSTRQKDSLPDRTGQLRKHLGLEVDDTTQLLKIALLEK
eukprot:3802813-Ditylum_brightwellii.AAC.1